MNISKKYFFFSKSESARSVFLGGSVYVSKFYTAKYAPKEYRYRGWGIAFSITIFDNEFVLGIVPFIIQKFTGYELKISKRLHAK